MIYDTYKEDVLNVPLRPMLWWFHRSLWQQAMTNWLIYLNFTDKFQYRLWISLSQIVVDGISCFVTSFILPDQFEALQEELDRRRQECLQLKVFRLALNHSRKLTSSTLNLLPRRCWRTYSWREGRDLPLCLAKNQRPRNCSRPTRLRRRWSTLKSY